jgi:hypothetical protein
VELFRPQGYRRLDAMVLTFAGQLALDQGDRAAARQHAETAHRLLVDMGNEPGRQRAAALLAAVAKAR